MTTLANLHVIFGAGPLAMSVARALLRTGARVRIINRSGSADAPAGVEVRAGNAYSGDETTALTKDALAVYQCAQPPYNEWPDKFPALQAAILEGAARNGAKLILAENLYMYGEVDGSIHEGLPYTAQTRKGHVRAQMTTAALQAHAEGKVRVAIARGSDFFGPGVLRSAMGERAILPALAGKPAQLIGRTDLPHTYTYIDDFGTALAILAQRDEALGQAWHVPNDRPDITQNELVTLFFERIGGRPRMTSVGSIQLAIAGLFVPEARETVEMMYEFNRPFIVDSGKFESAFDVHATPLREAVRKTVEWYRTLAGRK